jgi:hypothetical protein
VGWDDFELAAAVSSLVVLSQSGLVAELHLSALEHGTEERGGVLVVVGVVFVHCYPSKDRSQTCYSQAKTERGLNFRDSSASCERAALLFVLPPSAAIE